MLTDAGLPPGEIFAGAEGLKKGACNSTGSDPFSALEASQEGLSNSKRSTSDRISVGRFSGGQAHHSLFKIVEPVHEQQLH